MGVRTELSEVRTKLRDLGEAMGKLNGAVAALGRLANMLNDRVTEHERVIAILKEYHPKLADDAKLSREAVARDPKQEDKESDG